MRNKVVTVADILLKYQSITEKSMTNTEERALDIAEERYGKEEAMEFDAAGQMNIFIDGYTQGDADRLKIDVDKFYNWLKTKGKKYISICGTENVGYHLQVEGQLYTELKKAMETEQ